MKIWELDKIECVEYHDNHGRKWFFHDGDLMSYSGSDITNVYSWKELSKLSFKPYVNWVNIPIDTPILVSDDGQNWMNRYFAEYTDDIVYVYLAGATSWSSTESPTVYKYAKLKLKNDR